MDITATNKTTSRKWFVRISVAMVVFFVVAIVAWWWTITQWWQAVNYLHHDCARVTREYVGPAWLPEYCRFLPSFHEVRTIAVTVHMDNSDFRYLARIGRVGYLYLPYGDYSDSQMKLISNLRVRVMQVPLNRITDLGVTYLSKMSSLEELELAENPITNAALISLKSLPNLKKLGVSKTLITSKAAKKFARDTGVEVTCLP